MTNLDDLQKDSNRVNPVNGRQMPKHMANPHTNVDVVRGGDGSGGGQTTHVVEHEITVDEIANGQSFFDDVQLSLDAAKTYTFEVSGYSSQPLVQTSANRQDSTTVRVVVENQSGAVIPATPIVIKATSI